MKKSCETCKHSDLSMGQPFCGISKANECQGFGFDDKYLYWEQDPSINPLTIMTTDEKLDMILRHVIERKDVIEFKSLDVPENQKELIRISTGNDDDEYCTHCKEPAVYVVNGDSRCNYCGNQINLCVKCFNLLKIQVDYLSDLNKG